MNIKDLVKNFKNMPYKSKTSFTNKISMITNFIWAFIKLVLAGIVSSVFLSISGFYTMCTALAKTAYFDGRRLSKNQIQETKYFKRIAWTIFGGGLLYLFYILELFVSPKTQNYNMIVSIAIAAIAFSEIFFSIRGLIKSKKSNDLLLIGLKCINISSALSSIVLTQVAILSFSIPTGDAIVYNILTGITAGFFIILIALYMITKLYKLKEKSFKNIKTKIKYKRIVKINFFKNKRFIYLKTNKKHHNF